MFDHKSYILEENIQRLWKTRIIEYWFSTSIAYIHVVQLYTILYMIAHEWVVWKI